jgi:hypothetical protein
MTTEITKEQAPQEGPMPDLSVVADQLVAAARRQGVELTGPGGLLTGLTKQVLETALDVELTEHLGHERNERSGSGNVRNGSSPKTVRTDVGDVRITVPRDRAGSFAPVVVPKHSRRLAGFDDAVLSLYAKGLTTGISPTIWPTSTAARSRATWSRESPTQSSSRCSSGRAVRSTRSTRCC